VRLHFKPAFRSKKAHQICSQRMFKFTRGAQLLKVSELFLCFGIQRFQPDGFFSEPRDLAARKNIHGKIQRDRARMEKVKRPKIHGAAGKINPAGRVRNNGSGRWQNVIP
jgi:hypothetical protein